MNNLPSLKGLVLAGGKSRRMGMDKSSISFRDAEIPQWRAAVNLLLPVCTSVSISIRRGQDLAGFQAGEYSLIEDSGPSKGPMSGIVTAMKSDPLAAWLVVACDLPLLSMNVLTRLAQSRDHQHQVIAYKSAHDGLPEPLCTIYEPAFSEILVEYLDKDLCCPRKVLIKEHSCVKLLQLENEHALDNANTPEDLDRIKQFSNSPTYEN